jgi:hypothetical protein
MRERLEVFPGLDLPEQPRHAPSSVWPHRQEVDDVRPALTVLVAVAHQAGGDRVAVGLVTDQDAAEVFPSRGGERLDDGAQTDRDMTRAHVSPAKPSSKGPSDIDFNEDRGMVRRGLVDARDLGIDVPVLWGVLIRRGPPQAAPLDAPAAHETR